MPFIQFSQDPDYIPDPVLGWERGSKLINSNGLMWNDVYKMIQRNTNWKKKITDNSRKFSSKSSEKEGNLMTVWWSHCLTGPVCTFASTKLEGPSSWRTSPLYTLWQGSSAQLSMPAHQPSTPAHQPSTDPGWYSLILISYFSWKNNQQS